MRKLTDHEQGTAISLGCSISGSLLKLKHTDSDVTLEVVIKALTVALGSFLVQQERVQVHSSLATTDEIIEAAEAVVRKNAITSPPPSNN